jgi:hypothetical protein
MITGTTPTIPSALMYGKAIVYVVKNVAGQRLAYKVVNHLFEEDALNVVIASG